MNRCALAVMLLVLLRLAVGWHFYNEGVKKLDPSFSSAGFLRGAKGPLAPTMRGFVTGPHGAMEHLAEPMPSYEPGASESFSDSIEDWIEQISGDWDGGLARLHRLGASDSTLEEVRRMQAERLESFKEYLKSEEPAILDLRHEVWRLAKMEAKAGESSPAPFLKKRIADKRNEVWGAMQPWFKAAETMETSFVDDVVQVVADDVSDVDRIESAMRERSPLSRVDGAVAVVVLGCGILLFLGLFTPLAAVLAAGFLLTVMATQPPWVAGANTDYFFYQLVEFVALLTLAAFGAGRWAGFDRLVFGRPKFFTRGDATE